MISFYLQFPHDGDYVSLIVCVVQNVQYW